MKVYEDIFKLMHNFNPNQNNVDHRILYEVSGQRLTNDKYWDDSDEDNMNQLLAISAARKSKYSVVLSTTNPTHSNTVSIQTDAVLEDIDLEMELGVKPEAIS